MSAPTPAYGGFPPDGWNGLQALMSESWTSPPDQLPFAAASGYQCPLPHSTPGLASLAPGPALPLAGLPAPGRHPDRFSQPGLGFPAASAASARNDAGHSDLAPAVITSATSTTTPLSPLPPPPPPTPGSFSTLAGLTRQQNQAFAALHAAFASPHYLDTASFGAHPPTIRHPSNPRLPNANGLFDHFATATLSPPPTTLQPSFFGQLSHRACGLHILPHASRPVHPSPVPYPTPAPHQFGFYPDAPDSEVQGFDLRRQSHAVPRDEDNPPADDSQDQGEPLVDVPDEHARIAVDSLLDDTMPAATASRKRTRAASSLDDPAGPATVKRPRSRSGAPSVPSRRPVKPRRAAPTVVIPDSDDAFPIEDDDSKQVLFDMTENDNLPEEHKAADKDDTSTKLCKFECIICLDAASTLTVTHCGHMFCGPCLHQAMHAEVTKKICPMCRQKLDTRSKNTQPAKTAKTFFHLEMKLKLSKRQGKQPVRRARRV